MERERETMASFTSMLTPSFSLVGVASSAVVGIWDALLLRGGMFVDWNVRIKETKTMRGGWLYFIIRSF